MEWIHCSQQRKAVRDLKKTWGLCTVTMAASFHGTGGMVSCEFNAPSTGSKHYSTHWSQLSAHLRFRFGRSEPCTVRILDLEEENPRCLVTQDQILLITLGKFLELAILIFLGVKQRWLNWLILLCLKIPVAFSLTVCWCAWEVTQRA